MSRIIPSAMSEYVSVDNLPTGSVSLLMQRYEMPEKICVERYWEGLDKPEQLAYVPCRTAKVVEDEFGHLLCSKCGAIQPEEYETYYCWNCGRKLVNA